MNALRCSRFIYVAMRSYLKRILLVLGIICVPIIITAFSSASSPVSVGVSILVALFFLSAFLCIYTFYTCEKVPQLFAVLPQRRVDFVRGVYLNYLVLTVTDFVIGLITWGVFRLQGIANSSFPFFLCLIFLVFVAMVSVELPLAFKVGYAKVQLVFVAVILILGFLPSAISKSLTQQSLLQLVQNHLSNLDNPVLLVGFIIIALAALAVSYGTSSQIYRSRDI